MILLLFCLLNASEPHFTSLRPAPVQSSFISKWLDNQPPTTPLTLQSGYAVMKSSFGEKTTIEASHCTPMTKKRGTSAMRQSLQISLQKPKREALTLGNIYQHLHIFLFPTDWHLTIPKTLPSHPITLSSSLHTIGTSLSIEAKSIPSCLVVVPHHRSWLEAITFEHNPQHYFLKNLRAHLEKKAAPPAIAKISFEKKSPLAISQTPFLNPNSLRSLIFSSSPYTCMQNNLLAHYENKNAYQAPTYSLNFEKKSPLAISQTPFLNSTSIRSCLFGNTAYTWMQDNLLAHYENRRNYEAVPYSLSFEKKSPIAISQAPFLNPSSLRSCLFSNTAYTWMQDNLLAHYENRRNYEAVPYSLSFEKKSPIAISQAPFIDSDLIRSWIFSSSPYTWMQDNLLAHLSHRGEIDRPSDVITFTKKSPFAINQAPFTAPSWTYALAFEQKISLWLKNNLATYRQDTFATKEAPVRPTPFAASRSFWTIRPWSLANLSVPKAVSFPATEAFDAPAASSQMETPLAVIPGEIPIGLAKPNWQTHSSPQVPTQRSERFPWPKRVMMNHVFGDQADRHVPMASNYSTLGVMLAPDYRPGHFLTFGDLRAHYIDNNTYSGNIGIGTRYIPDGSTGFCHMIGLNLYYDCRQGSLGYFQQIGAGLEILGRRWDLRANVYGPIGKRPRICSCMFNEYIGDYFAVRHDIESVSNSFNAEFGYLFINGKSFSLYGAVGPYFLTRGRCVNNAIGVEGRIQPKYKDYLTLNFIARYDQIFGRILQADISLSIPLYEFRKRNLRPCGLRNWQIYQPVQRFEVMPLSQKSCWETNF